MAPFGNVVLVIASWVAFTIVVASPGLAVRHLLTRASGRPQLRGPRRSDFWLGYAALVAYLQLWSLVAPLNWAAWLLPLATIPVLVASAWRSGAVAVRPVVHLVRSNLVTVGLGAAALLLIANRSIGKALDYDLGLYHLQAIEFANRFAVIPGLGNLHDRLAVSNPQLLVAAFLDTGPWNVLGYHLLNGWLVAALVMEIVARVLGRGVGSLRFSTTLAALLPLAMIPTFMAAWGYRVASPNLDGAALVLVSVGTLFLVQVFEDDDPFLALATGIALIAATAAQRPLYTAWFVVVLVILLVRRRSFTGLDRLGPWVCAAALPCLLAVGTIARQVVVSGYPFFPIGIVRIPVEWAMSRDALSHYTEFVTRWARWPGHPESATGLGWLGHWTGERLDDLSVMPAVLLLGLALALWVTRRNGQGPRWDRWALASVVAPGVATLAVWFVTAPDPRFALPAIWLPAVALLAWAVPRAHLPFGRPIALALAAGTMMALTISQIGADVVRPVNPSGGGALGTEAPNVPRLVPWNVPGLALGHPDGSDQCWAETSCTAYDPAGLRLRGGSISSGFARR